MRYSGRERARVGLFEAVWPRARARAKTISNFIPDPGAGMLGGCRNDEARPHPCSSDGVVEISPRQSRVLSGRRLA